MAVQPVAYVAAFDICNEQEVLRKDPHVTWGSVAVSELRKVFNLMHNLYTSKMKSFISYFIAPRCVSLGDCGYSGLVQLLARKWKTRVAAATRTGKVGPAESVTVSATPRRQAWLPGHGFQCGHFPFLTRRS